MKSFSKESMINGKGKFPAMPYQAALVQYARSQGMKLWTVEDRLKVVARYENFAATKN